MEETGEDQVSRDTKDEDKRMTEDDGEEEREKQRGILNLR